MKEPCEECPRFNRCSVNNCPLHSRYPNLSISEDDEERKCTLGKSKRLQIAGKYPSVLEYGGLLKREWSWVQRPESKKKTPSTEALKRA